MLEDYIGCTSLCVSAIFCSISFCNLYIAHRKKENIRQYSEKFIFNQIMFISGALVCANCKNVIRNIFRNIVQTDHPNSSNRNRNRNTRNRNNNHDFRRQIPDTINIIIPENLQNTIPENIQEHINTPFFNELLNNLRSDIHRANINRFPESNTPNSVDNSNNGSNNGSRGNN